MNQKVELCPHGKERKQVVPRDFNIEEEYYRQLDAFNKGDLDNIESSTCMCCGQSYTKSISQSNVSRSGYCMSCGYNP